MKNSKVISCVFASLLFVILGCNFSTANMSGLETSTDKEGSSKASDFNAGETLYARAPIANNPGKVKVKFYLVAEDVKGLSKGDTLKGSDVSVEVDGDGVATYSVPVSQGFLPGTYTLHADMLNEAGEKKDSKTKQVTVSGTGGAPATDAPIDSDTDSDSRSDG